jgi:hypothetical protein
MANRESVGFRFVGSAASSGLALRRNQRRHPPRRPVLFGAHDFVTGWLDPGLAILHGGARANRYASTAGCVWAVSSAPRWRLSDVCERD